MKRCKSCSWERWRHWFGDVALVDVQRHWWARRWAVDCAGFCG